MVPRTADFWISEQGRAPRERTEVQVVADADTIYFAFRCHDSRPKEIHAQQTTRDASPALDDRVVVELDPYHNHRLLWFFSVNALGTQADTITGGRARKIEWKGDWQGAAQRDEHGWTAEIAVPFAVLEYAPGSTSFGVNFVRFHHRTQEWSRWADTTPQLLSEENGHLVGLSPPRPEPNVALLQYVAGGVNTPDSRGRVRNQMITTGFDVRADLNGRFKIVASFNPDFSQIEDDVLGLSFDYNEKIRRDHRPFFQEGSAFFPGRTYFFSGRVPFFGAGAKAFGRAGHYQFGVLGAIEGIEGRRDYAARLVRELGSTLDAGVSLVGTNQGEFDNHLAAAHLDGRLGRGVVVGLESAVTRTTPAAARDGSRLGVTLGYQGAHWYAHGSADRVDAAFFPANGFIQGDLLGTEGTSVVLGHSQEYATSWLRRSNASISFVGRNTLSDLVQRRQVTAFGSSEFRNNLQFSVGVTQGPYRPSLGTPGAWAATLNDDVIYTASLYQYTSNDRFGGGATYSWGNVAGSTYTDWVPSVWFRPVPQASVQYSYERADYVGVSEQHILTASWDITSQQGISARWVRFGDSSYRLVYRRIVRRGLDVFVVYTTDPTLEDRVTMKAVWTLGGNPSLP